MIKETYRLIASMGTRKLFMLNTHFSCIDKGFLNEFLYRFVSFFWVFLCAMFNLSGIIKYLSRSQVEDDSNSSVIPYQQDDQIFSNSCEDSESEFSFKFQSYKDDENKIIAQTESSVTMGSGLSMNTSKYQFMSGKYVGGLIEEPKTMSYTVEELFVGSSGGYTKDKDFGEKINEGSNHSSTSHDQFIDKDSQKLVLQVEAVDQEKIEDPVEISCSGDVLEEQKQFTFAEPKNEERADNLGEDFWANINISNGVHLLPCDSNGSSDELSVSTQKVGIYSNLHEDEVSESDTLVPIDGSKVEFIEIGQILEDFCVSDTSLSDHEVISGEKEEDTDDEFIELELDLNNSSDVIKESFWSKDFEDLHDLGNNPSEESELIDELGKIEEEWWEEKYESVSDEEEDILLEHENLIEQMKMELKNARTGGLSTILEESEDSQTVKMVEDLKPLKVDQKIELRDRMEEIHKFYKSYAGKMRKLDILNYQTMHAISFVQLKDPVQLTLSKKSSVSALKSLLLPKPSKLRKIYADLTLKSISELNRDLEVVYVGQVCLSWEILNWQHVKTKELMEYNSQGCQSYNLVAGEFQQFQVLLQRFIEEEPFEGPRIQNYVKKRGIVRGLLQVPAVKDDYLKDKKGKREEEENSISASMLAEIISESIRILWEFLRADKVDANSSLKRVQGTQDPADSQLLMDIKRNLQKKEKRLKDVLRSGNCIVKKFQKHQEDCLDRSLLVSQIELKLVSRVLSLSRLTTDQLVWCETKLNNINFVNRKINVEPSFLLFPC